MTITPRAFGTLMSYAWDQNRTKPINVYGPPRTADLVKAALQYFTVSVEIRLADGGSSGVLPS